MKDFTEYKVLARKYRPKKFKDLVGQNLLVEILSSAIINERLAHAYVLTGVRGVGKTTIARLIAMSINCQKREKNHCEPCGNCDSCVSTGIDSNLDVIEIDAASNTGVDNVREIIDNVKYKPVIGKFKIYIIDEVHMLSKSAFNALLKTLEEPPEHVKFIFATTEVQKIPITVLSRCQRFNLLRIEKSILTKYLLNIVDKEKIDIDKDAISLIVRAADGSMRDGLSLLDQAITDQNIKIDAKIIAKMLGLAEREKIYQLLENILKGNASESLDLYKNLFDLGADVIMIFDELLNAVHFITQIKISPNLKDDIYIPELERNKGFELSSKITLNNLNIIWQILFKGFQELQTGLHLFQHGEMIILRIIYFFDTSNPDNFYNNFNKDKVITPAKYEESNKSNQNKEQKTILESNNDNIVLENKKINNSQYESVDNFRQFVEMFFKHKEGILHTKLYNDVTLISFKEGEVTINMEKISDKDFIKKISKLISTWTGRIWKISSSSSNIGKSLNEEDIINQQKEIELMKNNSKVKKILKEFPDSKIHSITQLIDTTDNEVIIDSNIRKEK